MYFQLILGYGEMLARICSEKLWEERMSTEQVLSEYPWLHDRQAYEELGLLQPEIRVKRVSLDLLLSEQEYEEGGGDDAEVCFNGPYTLHAADGSVIEENLQSPREVVSFLLELTADEQDEAMYIVQRVSIYPKDPGEDRTCFDPEDLVGYAIVLYKPPKGFASLGRYVRKHKARLRTWP